MKTQQKKQKQKPRAKPAQVTASKTPKTRPNSSLNFEKPFESGGEMLGKKLGAFAGRLLGKITGVGDYSVDLPSGGSQIPPTAVPEFIHSDNTRETRIRHREYLGDVYASATAGAFKNTTYVINPGSSTTFPWLSSIAHNFDQWKPNGIAVVFKTLTSTYAASQSLGTVILATDYDVTDAPYADKIEMENSQFAVSGSAATCLMHPVECDQEERLTRLLLVHTELSTPDRFFDLGMLQVASSGCLANQLLGELWITYDISFYKPQLFRTPTMVPMRNVSFRHSGTPTGVTTFANPGAFSPHRSFTPTLGAQSIAFPQESWKGVYLVNMVIMLSAIQTDALIVGVSCTDGAIFGPQLYQSQPYTTLNKYPLSLNVSFTVDLLTNAATFVSTLLPKAQITLLNPQGFDTDPWSIKTTIVEVDPLISANGY